MRTRRGKQWIALVLVLLLIGMITPGMKTNATSNVTEKITTKNKNFTVEAVYGIDGLVLYDTPVLIQIRVTCKENFIGILRVTPSVDYGSTVVAYGEEITLSAGEAKTFTFVPTSINSEGNVKIELLNEKGKVVYAENNIVPMEGVGNKVTVGVLSDDYSALSYMDGLSMNIDGYESISGILELTKDSFPEDAKALEVLQYIIIDNFDTAQLSTEQYDTLKAWVSDGGVLILGLGNHYQNVLHCFRDDFVSGTLGTLGKQKVTWNDLEPANVWTNGSYVTEDGVSTVITGEETTPQVDTQTEDTQTEDTEVREDAGTDSESLEEESTETESEDTEQSATLNIDCISFELEGGEAFSAKVTEGSAYKKSYGLGQVVVLSYSLGMEPLSSAPNRKEIGKLLIEEAKVEGTLSKLYGTNSEYNYLYNGFNLSKLADSGRKPSVLLYGIILIAYVVLVGPILYVILKKMNKREKIWVTIPLVALGFTAIIYVTGFFYRVNKPLVTTFSMIGLEDSVKAEKVFTTVVCPNAQEYTIEFAKGYGGFRRNQYDYSYNIFGNGDNSDYSYMIMKQGDSNKVTFNNTEAFQENAFVLENNTENNIGSIDGNLTCKTTGFEGTVTNNTCYDLTEVVVSFENYLCKVGDVKKGETVTIDSSKVFQRSTYGSFSTPTNLLNFNLEKEIAAQANDMMEVSVLSDTDQKRGYIWGTVASYVPELTQNSKVEQSGCAVLYSTYTADYADITEGEYYSNIDSLSVASQGEFDEYDRMIYSSELVVTYSFEDCPHIMEMRVAEVPNTESYTYWRRADVYAYNMETGDYEQIFVNGDTIYEDEIQKYMKNGVLILKYISSDTNYTTYVPKISAWGVE
ncbi:MAG: tripartite tricarboxylate transporter TctB family protein [Lachnospiraceae bacterium]|nr:tripartite tricarboxylate transporter TctB family protein [Lachnospiraceae bacterium]